MCDDWWEEGQLAERFRLSREEADKLKRSTENLVPPGKLNPEQKPERQPQTQPDAVPV